MNTTIGELRVALELRKAFMKRLRLGIHMDATECAVPPHCVAIFVLNPAIVGSRSVPFEGEDAWPAFVCLDRRRDEHMKRIMGVAGEKVHCAALGRFIVFTDQGFTMGFLTTDPKKGRNYAAIRMCDYPPSAAEPMFGEGFDKFCADVSEQRIELQDVYSSIQMYMEIVEEFEDVKFFFQRSKAVDTGVAGAAARMVRGGQA